MATFVVVGCRPDRAWDGAAGSYFACGAAGACSAGASCCQGYCVPDGVLTGAGGCASLFGTTDSDAGSDAIMVEVNDDGDAESIAGTDTVDGLDAVDAVDAPDVLDAAIDGATDTAMDTALDAGGVADDEQSVEVDAGAGEATGEMGDDAPAEPDGETADDAGGADDETSQVDDVDGGALDSGGAVDDAPTDAADAEAPDVPDVPAPVDVAAPDTEPPACTGGSCDDTNPCTDDFCDPKKGCAHVPKSGACDDGNPCTTSDYCDGGACKGSPADCSDAFACTVDDCDPKTGCTHAPSDAACADTNVCTVDQCQVTLGCVHLDATAPDPCDDLDPCTTGDACAGSVCAGKPGACECQLDVECALPPDECVGPYTCVSNKCVLDPKAAVKCDTSKDTACSHSQCDPSTGDCGMVAVAEGQPCVADKCAEAPKCVGGTCKGTPKVCDDGNVCTSDTCDPGLGCVFVANTAACSDGDPCSVGDMCKDKGCLPGKPMDCADANACTTDGCQGGQCVHAPASGGSCDDGDLCTEGDTCASGSCKGSAASCDDGNSCTLDSCDPATGCKHANATGPCDDGNACTTSDTCSSGACVGGNAVGAWKYTYGGTSAQSLGGVALLTGGDLLASGQSSAIQANGWDAVLLRVSAAGKYVTQTDLAGKGNQEIGDLVISQGQGAVGYVTWVQSGQAQAHLMVLDAKTGIVSAPVALAETLNAEPHVMGVARLMDSGGGFVMVGRNWWVDDEGGTSGFDYWISRHSASGALQTFSPHNWEALGIVAPPSGGYAVLDYPVTLRGYTASGLLQWARSYDGAVYMLTPFGLGAIADGYVLAGNAATMQSSSYSGAWIMRLAADGTLVWFHRYALGSVSNFLFDITPTSDGGFAATGTYRDTGTVVFPWLLRTDGLGLVRWLRPLGAKSGATTGLVALGDGGFAISGNENVATGDTDGALWRTDAWGNATCEAIGACTSTTACDDTNPCTSDTCTGGACQHASLPDGIACGGVKVCKGGACVTGAAPTNMAYVPEGPFLLGCVPGDADCIANESPRHSVWVSGFYIDLHEVSIGDYKTKCPGCTPPATGVDCLWGVSDVDPQWPVNCVSRVQATTYCAKQGGRLPTEAEWERAARAGVEGKKYPWGTDTVSCAVATYNDGAGCDGGEPTSVGGKEGGKSAYGLHHMAGNVAEWTWTEYQADAYTQQGSGTASVLDPGYLGGCSTCVVRGGWYGEGATALRVSKRQGASHLVQGAGIGFRCVKQGP